MGAPMRWSLNRTEARQQLSDWIDPDTPSWAVNALLDAIEQGGLMGAADLSKGQ